MHDITYANWYMGIFPPTWLKFAAKIAAVKSYLGTVTGLSARNANGGLSTYLPLDICQQGPNKPAAAAPPKNPPTWPQWSTKCPVVSRKFRTKMKPICLKARPACRLPSCFRCRATNTACAPINPYIAPVTKARISCPFLDPTFHLINSIALLLATS